MIKENLTIEEYHSGQGVSKSDLDLISRSPAHYVAAKSAPREPTPAMLVGSAFHTAVLEPWRLEELYCVAPEGIDRRTKVGKEAWAAFQLENAGKEILKPDVMEAIRGGRTGNDV